MPRAGAGDQWAQVPTTPPPPPPARAQRKAAIPNPNPTAPPASGPTAAELANEQQALAGTSVGDAMADLQQFGMSPQDAQSLSQWYLKEQQQLKTPDQIQMDLYQTPEFARAFPGIVAQVKSGSSDIMSPSDYVTFKNDVYSMTQSMGLPKGFINDETIGKMVASNMNLNDLSTRISAAQQAASNANPQTLQLMDKWYGIKPTNGALAAFFLDPTHAMFSGNGVENQFTAAAIGGQAQAAGFTSVDQKQLLGLAQAGVSAQGAQSGIQKAASELALTKGGFLEGPGSTVSQQQLLGAQLGGKGAGAEQVAVAGAQSARAAKFGGGGGFGTGSQNSAGFASE